MAVVSRGVRAEVSKAVKRLVEEVAKEFEEYDADLAAINRVEQAAANGENRRSTRVRAQPDRLDQTVQKPAPERKRKVVELTPSFEMAPAPSNLRGILVKRPDSFTYPPPRKSSLTATAGKNIVNKYRKVRVCRTLKCKVIPPLPGWRPDRTRLPDVEPDDEEKERLAEKEKQDEADLEEQKKQKRRRKSIGILPLPVSDDDTLAEGTGEETDGSVLATPKSPDLIYEDFIKEDSPDSVLTDGETSSTRKNRIAVQLFAAVDEEEAETSADEKPKDTVDDEWKQEDTVEKKDKEEEEERGTVDAPTIDAKKRVERRRSVRIQAPVDEDAPKTEKRERRKSKMFPVTPMKESPSRETSKPAETKVIDRKERRKSGRIVLPMKKDEDQPSTSARIVPQVKKEEEDGPSTSARIPYNDDPCRSDERRAEDSKINERKGRKKVSEWLMKAEPSAADMDGGFGSDLDVQAGGVSVGCGEVIETTRGAISSDSISEISAGSALVEKDTRALQAKRKGRRSMKVPVEREEVGGKENESVSSRDSNEKNEGEESKKEKKKDHPFFAQFAPKSTPAAGAAPPTTAAAATVPEKKARRRSTFMPKKTAPAKREEISPPKEEKDKGEKNEEKEEEDAIEIVGEVKAEEKKREASAPSGHSTTSNWQSLEIDSAPYAGLVHTGWEGDVDVEKKEDEEVLKSPPVKRERMRSMRLPRLSSYAIPSSLRRREDSEDAETTMIFEEKEQNGLSEQAEAYARRARKLTGVNDGILSWTESLRPRTVEECMGDEEVLAQGKKWLQRWKKRLDAAAADEENATKAPKAKKRKRRGGNYSDESEREDSDSDYEMREDECRLPNPLVLSGPIGCGKTAYLHALSSEVGFSILESAPDERRTGACLRTKLSGAVANYRMSSSKPNGIASFFAAKASGDGKDEKERKKRRHTLVVIEHVDVIFTEEDIFFWPALAEILATTKIPIVLTCNVIPSELTRVLRQMEETGGGEAMEMNMERMKKRRLEEYVEASLSGTSGRWLAPTVIPSIAARARNDLRATLNDAHWAAAGNGALARAHLNCMSMRRVEDPTVCDTVSDQSFVRTDESERREATRSNSELHRVAEWPSRGAMPAEVHKRICDEIDKIDLDAYRASLQWADRMMEIARSGIGAGTAGRSSLLTRSEIACDWMPILQKIDEKERAKKRENRRHQHYFNVVNLQTGQSIDPVDSIQRACPFFRLPKSQTDSHAVV